MKAVLLRLDYLRNGNPRKLVKKIRCCDLSNLPKERKTREVSKKRKLMRYGELD